MSSQASLPVSDVRHDGFGSRQTTYDEQFGPVDVIELTSALGTPAAEQAIRAAAARHADAGTGSLARVVRIARRGGALSLTTLAVPGVALADLLAALEFGTISLGDTALLGVAGATAASLAAMHRLPGAPAHGALSPSHVVACGDGTVVLTGSVFGDALQALQWNREQLWRVFAVAMPPSASLPRFDQRSDVTQLGALVLSVLLRRALNAAEYPKQTIDLIETATESMDISARCRTALRLWLQQTLQLQPKALFGSAADAARAFTDVVSDVQGRQPALEQLQRAIRELSGQPEPVAEAIPAAPRAIVPPPVAPPSPAPQSAMAALRGLSFLRSVFPAVRAN
jgi:hypothetical protein